jgi:hypothetical protein
MFGLKIEEVNSAILNLAMDGGQIVRNTYKYVSTELFSSNGYYTVACTHSCYLAMDLHITMYLSPHGGWRNCTC